MEGNRDYLGREGIFSRIEFPIPFDARLQLYINVIN